MRKTLLIVTGVANLLGCLFHIAMFWAIGHMPAVTEQIRSGMYAFNILAVLALAYLTYVLLAHGKDVMTTSLGTATLWFAALIYLPRAVKDAILMKFGWTFGFCLVAGVLHLILLYAKRRPAPAV